MRTKVALISIVCAIFTSCDPKMFDYNDCIWVVKNDTSTPITFSMFVDQNIESREIMPEGSIVVQKIAFSNNEEIPFSAIEYKDSVAITLDGQMKKIWRKHNDKNEKHFYNRVFWSYYKTPKKDSFESCYFTFTIEESDLD